MWVALLTPFSCQQARKQEKKALKAAKKEAKAVAKALKRGGPLSLEDVDGGYLPHTSLASFSTYLQSIAKDPSE